LVVTELEPYIVSFKGGMADQPVDLMVVNLSSAIGGLEGGATSTVTVEGRFDGVIIVTSTNLGDAKANAEAQPIVLSDKLPDGLRAVNIEGVANTALKSESDSPLECSLEKLTCE
jgi:hypothetical protein